MQPKWKKQFEDWRELLGRCAEKSNRKRVHALRVATLRLKAEVDFRLLDAEATSGMGEAVQRWNKHAKKLRKVLSPVRDTDVHLELLERLRAAQDSVRQELTASCIQQIDELEKGLHQERKGAEKELLKAMQERQDRLERSSRKLEEACIQETAWAETDRALLIRGIIAGLATEVNSLNAATLHEFRKQAKTARYLADISARHDSRIARQAALLKKMQNAAGKWHDLQTLADKAQDILAADAESELVGHLKTLAQQSLDTALEVCRSAVVELLALGAWMGTNASLFPPKKPVRSVRAADLKTGISAATR